MRRVALVSDLTDGGAAVACRRLKHGLDRLSFETVWGTADGSHGPDVFVTGRWPNVVSLFKARLVAGIFPRKRAWADCLAHDKSVAGLIRRMSPDVINIHGIHERMSFSLLSRLPVHTPIVWTMHDMWPFTGYCHYSYDCDKYLNGCSGECPQLGRCGDVIVAPDKGWRTRQAFFADNAHRIALVSPSRWLANLARRRFAETLRIECIPNGIDLNVFRPVADRESVRRVLGLPVDRKVVLVNGHVFHYSRKGTRAFVDAARQLVSREKEIEIVSLGNRPSNEELPGHWIFPGYIHDEALLNLFYNAADVFVLPSLADNLPNTLVEATAAGTPCVTFDVGGCGEVVIDGETGFVAKYKNIGDLTACIEKMLAMPADGEQQMREICRKRAEQKYDCEIQAGRYGRLFEELFADR